MLMAIFVMLRKWFDFLIALCDLSVWTLVQCGKKPHSGGERSETSAVIATSAARMHRKGRSGYAGRASETHPERTARNERARVGFGASEKRIPAKEKGCIRHISAWAGGRGPRARHRGQRLQGWGVRGPIPGRAPPLSNEHPPTFIHNHCYHIYPPARNERGG